MDINLLLSPSEQAPQTSSTPTTPAPVVDSPRKHVLRTLSGSSKSLNSVSPRTQIGQALSNIPQHVISPRQTPNTSSPLRSPSMANITTTQSNGGAIVRTSSTQSMDTLADLASMQHHQPVKAVMPGLQRSRESYESQLSPSTIFPTVAAVSVTSNPRSSFDIGMMETPKQAVRTDFSGTSLSFEAQKNATSLASYISENPAAYESHVNLIKILHQGFVDHVYPPAAPDDHGDPHSYDLLLDLRIARDNMDKLFSVGEELWADWIQDESMLARTIDEQVGVWEKSQKAVLEEAGSTKLWKMCGDWILHCYRSSNEPQNGAMSEEDQALGRGVFTWEMVLETWKQAALVTNLRLNDSHLIWDTYVQLLIDNGRMRSTNDYKTNLMNIFQARLQTPHANWDYTFQVFSTFVSEHYPEDYESIMASSNKDAADAKRQWQLREEYETNLQRAEEVGDRTAEYAAFVEYITWEKTPEKRRKVDFEMTDALYLRAELRFPAVTELWEDHVLFVLEVAQQRQNAETPLSLLDRATRHCPWSGSLWSQYLIMSERSGQIFQETEEIKHKATSNGLLDIGGMEEVLKFHTAWCSYLRRRAFRANANDEDLDVAEMGIRSSIENVQELATKRFGFSSNPDPLFRLERIYISYLSEKGSWDSAREAWKNLAAKQGDSWEFWLKYYGWEMMCWSRSVNGERNGASAGRPGPQYATALLKAALKRPTLDWPEKIMQTLISHCEDYEDVEELQLAVVEVRKLEKLVTEKRQAEAAATMIQQAEKLEDITVETMAVPIGTKRKWEVDVEDDDIDEPSKKAKLSEERGMKGIVPEKIGDRDREHATIIVHGLPENVTETKIRQFFRDCGTINSLKISHHDGTSAVVEFDEKEAAQYALSRDSRTIDNATITVQIGTGSVLFVANYPPTADESFIRGIFAKFGNIVEVRLPSLINNTHRRFCYVHFESPEQAQAATELDGHELENGKKLIAKISDPSRKQARSGALEEGRELHVKNIHWGASEHDVQNLFAKFGHVQSVRIPRDLQGKSKGFAFVVFEKHEEAQNALELNDYEFRGRNLHVEIATKKGAKRQATTIISRPDHSNPASISQNGDIGSPAAMSIVSENADLTTGDRRERTIALMGVPDTVNDSRIRSLAEQYGKLVKVSLRPDHQGAILEYQDARDAAKASLQLQGHEIDPGRMLTVGTVKEMLKQKPEKKVDKIQVGKAKHNDKPAPTSLSIPGIVKRPGQPVPRKGGRLGQKRAIGFQSLVKEGDDQIAGGKTNDDFRAMLKGEDVASDVQSPGGG